MNSLLKGIKYGIKLSAVHQNNLMRMCEPIAKPYHVSCTQFGLMEFFDDKKNWGAQEVKVGRAWKKEELRIKSNVDLHKLWYVLLKERNMLLTMEEACKQEVEYFPNPERIDKVEESMKNLEEVVRERNKAYWELEVGETGERPVKTVPCDIFDWKTVPCAEHSVPASVNPDYIESALACTDEIKREFHVLYDEQTEIKKKRELRHKKNQVIKLMKRMPNITREALEENFPEVDIDNLKHSNRSYGHYDPEERDPSLR